MQNDIARAVEELFLASGLGGFTIPYESGDCWNVWYTLPRVSPVSTRVVCYVCCVSTEENGSARANPVLGAEVCLEGSGRTLFSLDFTEPTLENALEAAEKLVEWIRERQPAV